MTTTAKFAASGTGLLTLANLGAEFPNFPELVLSGAHNAAVTTITLTTAVPATWPTTGGWVTIDSEIIQYTGVSGSTLTVCTRGSQSTTAATHADAAKVGLYLTAATVNQIIADLIAVETQALVGPSTNLVLNSDFSRRNVFGLAMPEVFADLSGTTKIDGGAAGSVASNIFTQGAANNEYAWCAGSFVWRDGRASATFKATAIAGIYELRFRIDATHYVSVKQNNGNFTIVENTGGGVNVLSTTANVLTINRWYWIEVNLQGTTVIAKIYDTTVTTPGTVKGSLAAAATLTQTTSFNNTGSHVSITSDQAAAQWGGIATGNGGVYVETWLPESYTISFGGTLGGQAIGFNEAVDSGPNKKQWALRGYIPAISRTISASQTTPNGAIIPSTSYATSFYTQVTGYSTGTIFRVHLTTFTSAAGVVDDVAQNPQSANTAWARKSTVLAVGATAAQTRLILEWNNGSDAVGTCDVMLVQYEQGSAATAYRNAPADDAPIVWELVSTRDLTGLAAGEADSRDLAGNFFLPWDATLDIRASGAWSNSGANDNNLLASVDGANTGNMTISRSGATVNPFTAFSSKGHASSLGHAAGKTRIALRVNPSAGTISLLGTSWQNTQFIVTAYRAK